MHSVQSAEDPSRAFYRSVLPNCQKIVEAIGHRMAYDSAAQHGVPSCLLDLYLYQNVNRDLAWYVEHGYYTRGSIVELGDSALDAAVPCLDDFLMVMDVEGYVAAPIVSNKAWADFEDTLETFSHHSVKAHL